MALEAGAWSPDRAKPKALAAPANTPMELGPMALAHARIDSVKN